MGRRKIEIKAIKDDRNRSVTFLKRKGGLFKKAHELSVLCSVDVAVIIFGQNKKLYEYSSGDINEFLGRYQYYGGPHEHKGPADFANKGGNDEDDEDEENIGSPGPEEPSSPQHGVVPQVFHNQPTLQHMKHTTPSASPPMPNGMFQAQRLSTPQPHPTSRPTSRNQNHVRRPSSNLVPQDHPQPQASQPAGPSHNYGYHANQGFYQQAPGQGQMQMHQQHGHQQHVNQHHYSNPIPLQAQLQETYAQENRRQSMPPNFPLQGEERPLQGAMSYIPQRPQRPFHTPPLPEQPVITGPSNSHSIYTPIDDSRSMLAQHWGMPNIQMSQRNDLQIKSEAGPRSQSIDVGSAMRNRINGASQPNRFQPPPAAPVRTASMSGIGQFGPPLRTDSIASDVKRPRLTVQIPSEASDGGSAADETGESSAKKSGNSTSTPPAKAGTNDGSHGSGVVLPPPSPSASALLSAGATGPKNPFARPPPPNSSLNNTTLSYRDSETPLSALPSRFMSDGFLPSPSTFYSDWTFGQASGNNLASPAIYQPTPIANHGPSFRDEDPHNKRKSDEDGDGVVSKKTKP